ncbi:MAG: type II secretion system protein GspG [Planctomycetes bacterium]|nr:type II secretion system protein GspG [Planctomycetota bacterium]
MNVLLALALLAGLQESKPVQGRDEILKQDVDNAIKKLNSPRYTESFVAAEELKELGRRAVPALVAELGKKDAPAAVKRALCEILGAIRDPGKDVLTALAAKLKDPDEFGTSIASAAARALAMIGDDASIPAIVDVLKSKAVESDRVLKYECIRAAGLFRAKDAVESLRKALDDKKPASAGENDDAPLIAAAAADALGLIRALDAADDLANKLSDVTNNPSSSQTLGVHAARALQRILEHELRGKSEKDEPRAGALAGEATEIKATLDAWTKWWASKSAKKNIEETKVRLSKLSAAVAAYKAEQGSYPLILQHLKTKPESAKTFPKDGYYQGELKDAWNKEFLYRTPGTGADFDIVSYGADQRTWGAGDNADLWNHDKWREAKKAETKKAIEDTVKAIELFKADNERYPGALLELVSRPPYPLKKEWPKNGYLPLIPKDGYDNFLRYDYPSKAGATYDVYSYGADGVEGGTDENEDLWNHDKRPPKKEEPKKDEKK